MPIPGSTEQPADRRDVDHRSAALGCIERLPRLLRPHEHAAEVDLPRLVVAGEVDVHRRPEVRVGGGVVDEDVDAAEALDAVGDGRRGLVRDRRRWPRTRRRRRRSPRPPPRARPACATTAAPTRPRRRRPARWPCRCPARRPVTSATLPSSESSIGRDRSPEPLDLLGWPGEPPRRRDQPLPAPARRQPGRLVPVGRRGLRRGPASATCPILLSVGYSACHWCHVMAHESFEDPAVAAVMNRAVREREGRPRGAARRRRHLHGGHPGHDRPGRLADDGVPARPTAARSSAAPTSPRSGAAG